MGTGSGGRGREGQGEALGSRKDAEHGLPGWELRRSCSRGSLRPGAQLSGEHSLCSRCQNCLHSTEEALREVQTPARRHTAGDRQTRIQAQGCGTPEPHILTRISHSPSQSVSWQGLRGQPHGGARASVSPSARGDG